MILNALMDSGFVTTDGGLTFNNGFCSLTTVGGGGSSDGYPTIRPSIVTDPYGSNRRVMRFTVTCPADTYDAQLHITRAQVDLTTPAWIRDIDTKWLYWRVAVPSATATAGNMVALLSMYSNNSGLPAIRPGAFHAFIGDGTDGVSSDWIAFRSNNDDVYPREIARIPTSMVVDKWLDVVVNVKLEGNSKTGMLCLWVNDELLYSSVGVKTIYHDTVDVHFKPGGLYFWAGSPISGQYHTYSSGMVIGSGEYKTYDDFMIAAGLQNREKGVSQYMSNPHLILR